MNRLEFLESKVVALSVRVESLERAAHARLALDADDLAAQAAAERNGFAPELVRLPACCKQGSNHEKKIVARSLRAKGWGKARIARVLRCSERTVTRWLEAKLARTVRTEPRGKVES